MNPQWYCCIRQQQYGPLPFEQLQQWVAEGRLSPDDHVCLVGQQQWNVARNVPGLIGPVQSAAGFSPPAPAEAGLNFSSGPSSPRTPRTATKPKDDLKTFKWGSAILAGVLAAVAGTGRLMKLSEQRQQAVQQRQQEVRRQQKINTPPPLPPIRGANIDMEGIDREIKKARNRRP